jgi:hypothetical protein
LTLRRPVRFEARARLALGFLGVGPGLKAPSSEGENPHPKRVLWDGEVCRGSWLGVRDAFWNWRVRAA